MPKDKKWVPDQDMTPEMLDIIETLRESLATPAPKVPKGPVSDYQVRWITRVDDVGSFFEAAKEAWADIMQTVMAGEGATVLVVDEITVDENGEHHERGVAFDMAKPWEPRIVATHNIEKDDPKVVSPKDEVEVAIFGRVMEKIDNLRKQMREQEKAGLPNLFDNGDGLVN